MKRRGFIFGGAAFVASSAVAHDVILPDGSKDQTQQLQEAIDRSTTGEVLLGRGEFNISELRIKTTLRLSGIPGFTVLRSLHETFLSISETSMVTVEGIYFVSENSAAKILVAQKTGELTVRNCQFRGGGTGIWLEGASGRIEGNVIAGCATSGIFSNDARGLAITGNVVSDIGNNGIQVWQSEKREDGTLVTGNRVSNIAAKDGGTGQNGNGINVYRAGNVIVSNNRISDCAFSGIRNNSGDAVQISGNSISRSGEVAIYVEFSFEGAVVANNVLTDVSFGISITNLDVGGRLAAVTGNLIRNAKGGTAAGVTAGGGIHAEADTLIANNVIENAKDFGINLGWGNYARNLTAQGNLIRNSNRSISASVTQGAGSIAINANHIAGAKGPAILAMDHDMVVSEDLATANAVIPPALVVSGNVVTP